jgi:hypothetical protein
MNEERYNQIMDEAYKNYTKKMVYHPVENWLYDENGEPTYRQLSQDEFINKCKIDQEFSERWELKIEKRELSSSERWKWYGKNGGPNGKTLFIDMIVYQNEENNSHIKSWLEKYAPNVPTKLITLTYNGEKIEVYE